MTADKLDIEINLTHTIFSIIYITYMCLMKIMNFKLYNMYVIIFYTFSSLVNHKVIVYPATIATISNTVRKRKQKENTEYEYLLYKHF